MAFENAVQNVLDNLVGTVIYDTIGKVLDNVLVNMQWTIYQIMYWAISCTNVLENDFGQSIRQFTSQCIRERIS